MERDVGRKRDRISKLFIVIQEVHTVTTHTVFHLNPHQNTSAGNDRFVSEQETFSKTVVLEMTGLFLSRLADFELAHNRQKNAFLISLLTSQKQQHIDRPAVAEMEYVLFIMNCTDGRYKLEKP